MDDNIPIGIYIDINADHLIQTDITVFVKGTEASVMLLCTALLMEETLLHHECNK